MMLAIIMQIIMVAALVWSIVVGYRRGGVIVLAEIGALVIATALSFWLAQPLGRLLATWTYIQPYSYLIAFFIIWLVAQAFWLIPLWPVLLRVPASYRFSRSSRFLGAIANGSKSVVIIWLFVVSIPALPVAVSVKKPLADAAIPHTLSTATIAWQPEINKIIDQQFSEALGFLTVRSQDNEVIVLSFTYRNGQIDADAETQILNLLNAERAKRGLTILISDPALQRVARLHSQDMLERGYFSHNTPEGLDPFDRLKAAGISFLAAGENLALAQTAQQAHDGLMNSPKHRDNILSPDYGHVGIGVIDGGKNGIMVTQEFTD